jgi:hypothetical protein
VGVCGRSRQDRRGSRELARARGGSHGSASLSGIPENETLVTSRSSRRSSSLSIAKSDGVASNIFVEYLAIFFVECFRLRVFR